MLRLVLASEEIPEIPFFFLKKQFFYMYINCTQEDRRYNW